MGNYAGEMIDIRGAFDIHFHPAPCLFPRRATDYEIAEAASLAGFAGLVLKCHHESTVSRASILKSHFPHMHIFGGIVLNRYVGGYNPKAVEAALALGGKEVWLPTIDAAYHAKVHGSTGKYDVQDSGRVDTFQGLSAVEGDHLTREAAEIFQMVAQANIILGTSHQSYEELKIIIREAHQLGVKKILLTHPFFKVPGLTLEQVQELVGMGAIAEFGYCTISPMWAYSNIEKMAQAIRTLDAKNCVLISDAGQRHNPMPSEALFLFAQGLFEKGISKEEIDTMIRINPARLLNVDIPDGSLAQ
ncbi:MAG: DUF6282 family protein [Bellilinea sp.]